MEPILYNISSIHNIQEYKLKSNLKRNVVLKKYH